MTHYDYDFNNAESTEYQPIPKGTLAKIKLKIKPGFYNDESKGWTGGYATQGKITGAVYLQCEYTILAGEYKGRKVWSMIGLYSHKNDNLWGNMGRSFIRSILNSAHGFTDNDNSEEAVTTRKISSFEDLDGLEFVAKIDVEQDINGGQKNVINKAISPNHQQYKQIMNQLSNSSSSDSFVDDQIPWNN